MPELITCTSNICNGSSVTFCINLTYLAIVQESFVGETLGEEVEYFDGDEVGVIEGT